MERGFEIKNEEILILIVDDSLTDIFLLEKILRKEGYRVMSAVNGKHCFDVLSVVTPDLILLDIIMPDIDGYEVCRRLKEDDNTREIPIIFISAQVEKENIVSGFKEGAVDYITKPFYRSELLIRVKNHLKLKKYSDMISDYIEKLNIEYLKREKLDFLKDKFLAMISHDIKNPIVDLENKIIKLLEKENIPRDEITENLKNMKLVVYYLKLLLGDLVDIAAIESGNIELVVSEVDYKKFLLTILKSKSAIIKEKNIQFVFNIPDDLPVVFLDERKIVQVLNNLIDNAVKFLVGHGVIEIVVEVRTRTIITKVIDNGPGISKEDQKYIFDKYRRVKRSDSNTEGSGLGLSIVKSIIETHRGTVGVESKPGQGACFYFTLPLYFDL